MAACCGGGGSDSLIVIQEFNHEACKQSFEAGFRSGRLDNVLKEHWKKFVPTVFSGRLEPDTAKEERRANRLLFRPMETFLCDGDPDVVFKKLKEYDDPPVLCGKVFKFGEPTYSCRDCGMDPTCVLCIECFQCSAHKNHKYKMSTSGGGGYCDCGDVEAWQSEPFCDIHKRGLHVKDKNKTQPVDNLPDDLRSRASQLFDCVIGYAVDLLMWQDCLTLPEDVKLDHISDVYVTMLFNDEVHTYEQVINALVKAISCTAKAASDFATIVDREGRSIVKDGSFADCDGAKKIITKATSRGQNSKPLKVEVMHTSVVAHQIFALKIFSWVRQLISYSDGLRQLFSIHLVNSRPGGQTAIVRRVMVGDTQLWKAARVQSHQLFMAGILMDADCKKQFAIMFTEMYAKLMALFVADDHDHSFSVVSQSVQLFTVPTLARMLISDYNLLEIIIKAFLTECTPKLNDKGTLMFERQERNNAFRRAQYSLYDLKYALLGRPSAGEWNNKLRLSFLKGFRSLLQLLRYMQGMDGITRRTDQHIEYEPEWESAFNVQLKLSDSLAIIQDWCSTDTRVLVDAYVETIRELIQRHDGYKFEKCTIAGYTASCIKYDFSVNPISVHQPLTRILAGLSAILNRDEIFKEELLKKENASICTLMEPSLLVLVLVAQCNAGMWRRNGFSLHNQVFFYQSVKCRTEMYDKDILMVQLAASLMGSNEFLVHLLYKFGLLNWAKEDYDTSVTQEDSVKQIITLAEHFLSLVIFVICERYTLGVGKIQPGDALRREIIHQLCIQPMSHSELTKSLMEDPYKETRIEEVVETVATFKKPTGNSGKGLYELKPEFYSEYTPYFCHYARTEQVKSEETQRKRRIESGENTALYPPSLPQFHGIFANVVNLLQADVMIYIIKLVLQRSIARWSKSWSEAQLEKVLFLTALGIEEEEKCIANELPFNFSFKATLVKGGNSIFTLLEMLATNPSVSHKAQKDLIACVLQRLVKLRRSRDMTFVPKTSVTPSHQSEEKLEKERKKKTDLATKRRDRIMAQMQKMQRNFIKENKELFESTSTEMPTVSSTASMDISVSADDGSCPPVALGAKRSAPVATTDRQMCILCQEEQDILHNDRAMVLSAFVQKSTVLSKNRGVLLSESADNNPLFMRSDLLQGTHTSACGHVMHADCWRRFYEALVNKESRRNQRLRLQPNSYDITKNEFLCPLCETVSNTVLPLIPQLSTLIKDSEEKEVDLSLTDWLDGIQKTVQSSIQQHIDRESQGESFLFVPCPLSSVTKMMTESVARNFQLLFDYVYDDDDASANFSDSIIEMLRKFSTDVYTTGLGVLPDEENTRVPVMVWSTCAYSIICIERSLRDEGKALFGSLASRQAECLGALIRLAAVCSHINTPTIIKEHCVTLLSALLCGSHDNRLRDTPCILDIDMFHLLLSICLSMPTLYTEEEDRSSGKKLNLPMGCLSDSHALHLIYSAHLVQIILSTVAEETDDSMETDIDFGAEAFLKLFLEIRQNAGLQDDDQRIVAFRIHKQVRDACMPFLRCAAIFFHYLTGVAAPLRLFEFMFESMGHITRQGLVYLQADSVFNWWMCFLPIATELMTADVTADEFDLLCHYLNLPTCFVRLLTESNLLGNLVESWTKDNRTCQRLADWKHGEMKLVTYPHTVNRLIALPHDYSDLINQAATFTCPKFFGSDDSRSPAMCLVCGSIVCSQSYCCQTVLDEIPVGAATAHAAACGAGTGVFLRVRDCQVLLLSGRNKGCFCPPPYLDVYGETDEGLRRGNPLYLCEERYRKLQKLWLLHGIAEEIVHNLETNSGYSTIEWHNL